MNAAMANGELVFNTSMLWTDSGPVAQHAKRYPVPFGEYVPQRELYERIVPSLIEMIGPPLPVRSPTAREKGESMRPRWSPSWMVPAR